MRNDQSISEKLASAGTLIDNSLTDPEILAKISEMGYDEAALNEGKQLKDEANTLHLQQIKEYGEQFGATQALHDALDAASEAYMNAVIVARIAFKNDVAAQSTLQITGPRSLTVNGLLDQAEVFYSNLLANPEMQTPMQNYDIIREHPGYGPKRISDDLNNEKYGYVETKLQEEQAMMEAARQAYLVQYKEKGDAQAATKARDAKLDKLNTWVYDFKTIARIALKDEPQKLERLGILVRS